MSISQPATQAREGARQRNGEFGEQHHSAPEMTLGSDLDLSTATPVDIDTQLGELYFQIQKVNSRLPYWVQSLERAQKNLDKVDADGERYEGQRAYLEREMREAREKVDEIHREVDQIQVEAAPYETEFRRRGGWSRAFLTTTANGHVHSSMHCSTCNRDGKATSFAWMTDYSGQEEETIVADAGERACTTCYPSAPVDVLSRPTKMFTPDEKRKQEERAERERAKVEKDRKRIANGLTADGSEFVVQTDPIREGEQLSWRNTERFKTERSAIIWATDTLAWRYGKGDERDAQRVEAVRVIAEAVAAKHGRPVEFVLGEFEIKADVKAERRTAAEGKKAIAALAAEHGVTL